MSDVSFAPFVFETHVPVVIIGAGAAGLTAALVAHSRGREVLVLERDALPQGSTALSAGLIPAGGTRWQREQGIEDSPEQLSADVMHKAHDEPDPALVDTITSHVGLALEWLADHHDLPFSVIANFNYPGHSAHRMHGLPSRSGAELMDRLRQAAEDAGIALLCEAKVTVLHAEADKRITGVSFERPDGSIDHVGCDTLILACNGYGGNKALVAAHIPALSDALYFGHPGNQGEAVLWGQALGAALGHLSGHQGHGSVAHPHGILITWATIMEGGFQVNLNGERFSNESQGYSEQASAVLAQPEGIAFTIFDERIASIARQFEDFRSAEAQGAIVTADSLEALPAATLVRTAEQVAAAKAGEARDAFGRDFSGSPALVSPFKAVRVTGALFHTQGGLKVDGEARVVTSEGFAFPNLLAVGGAACGISGARASGYLSGNGLMSAVGLGFVAGRAV
jgi:fumarate reductase flavoprotein subunit